MNNTSEINDLQEKVAKFITKRDWDKFHNPKNIAMSINIEASELMEIFQWYRNDEITSEFIEQKKSEIEDEVADVFIYLLSFINKCQIDLKSVTERKMERNEFRFPVEKIKGKLG